MRHTYCTNCGNEVKPGAKYCSYCGTETDHNEITIATEPAASPEPAAKPVTEADKASEVEIPPYKPEKSPRFKILVIAITAFALIFAAAAWAAVSSGIFLSPKQFYTQVEGRNYIQKSNEIREVFNDASGKYKELLKEKPCSFDTSLQLTIDSSGIPEEGMKLINLLNTLKLHYNIKTNPSELQTMQDLGLSIKGNEMANLKLYTDKTKVYAQMPVLLDKYFFLDLKDLKSAAENLGLDTGYFPESITEDDIRKAAGLDGEEKSTNEPGPILKKYAKLYFQSIPDECLKLERGSSIRLEGKNIRCSKLSLKFDEDQFKDFILCFTAAMKDDDELYGLISDKMRESSEKFSKNICPSRVLNINSSLSRADYKEIINNLEDMVKNDLNLSEGISMTLWVNNGRIVKRSIETVLGGENDRTGIELQTSGIKASDGKYRTDASIVISNRTGGIVGENISLEYKGSSSYDRKKKADLFNGEVGFKANLPNSVRYDLTFGWETESSGSQTSGRATTQYDMKFSSPDTAANSIHLYGEFKNTASEDIKQKTLRNDMELSAYLEPGGQFQGEKYGGRLQLVTERAYDIDFALPGFENGKIVDLGSINGPELSELGNEAGKSLEELVKKNPMLNDYGDFGCLTNVLEGNVTSQPVMISFPDGAEDEIYRINEFGKEYAVNTNGNISYTDEGGKKVSSTIFQQSGDSIQKLYYGTYKGRFVFIAEIGDSESAVSCLSTVDRDLKARPWDPLFFGGFNTGDSIIDGNRIYLNSFSYVGAVDLDSGDVLWKHEDLSAKYDVSSFSLKNSEGDKLEYEASTNGSETLGMTFDKSSGSLESVTDSSGRDVPEPSVTKVGFARSIDPESYEPYETVSSFNTSDRLIYYVIKLDSLPAGVDVKYTWKLNGNPFSSGSSYLEQAVSGRYFQSSYNVGDYESFPPGTYAVELVGTKYGVELFRVEDTIELTDASGETI